MNPATSKLTVLLGTASILTMAGLNPAHAQQAQTAQAGSAEVPEQVLITGSLIRGTAAVGVPVTSLGTQDFRTTGALTTSDVLKTVPSAVILPETSSSDPGANNEKPQGVNLRGLSTKGNRTLMLIDGWRFPPQGDSGCTVDPSIVPQLAIDRVDVLADGASATYGSDAVAGVINLILKRGYDGAITEGSFGISPGYGHAYYRGSVLYGTTWDGGDVTISYEHYNEDHTNGTARDYYTFNFYDAQGVDNRTTLINSLPGTITIGNAKGLTASAYTPVTLPGVPGSFSTKLAPDCTNCYAIPKGQNGQGLTWAQIVGNTPLASNGTTLGTGNVINPYTYAWELPDQERNAATITFDQNVMPNVQFFADGFYNNRRDLFYTVGGLSPGTQNALQTGVPTSNPYYPIGAPAGLLVNYDLSAETPSHIGGTELAERYDGGFNITLPGNWLARIYGSASQDNEVNVSTGLVNSNNVSAALGWTVPAKAGLASFTKPANVPYLNLFCDPTQFTCNAPATLNYITGYRDYSSRTILNEFGVNADGPVYTLPGGDLKAAVGALYDHTAFFMNDVENYNAQSLAQIQTAQEYDRLQLWAVFGQLDIPIVGDNNRLPFIDSLNVQVSARYDHYNLYGGTTNPKVAATWSIIDGLQLQGSWGTSFRAPSFQEAGAILGALDQPINAAAGSTNNLPTCASPTETPPAGTAAAYLGCGTGGGYLGGIRLGNGAGIAAPVRHGGSLQPETAQTLIAGTEWAPTDNIFKGLDIQATYFFTRIRNELQGCPVGTATGGLLDDPLYASCFVTRATDPTFDADVAALLSFSKSQVPTTISPSNISFVADGAIRNIGWQDINGVDFSASYVLDLGDWGAWNTGVTGEYIIDQKSQYFGGQPIISAYSTVDQGTANSGGRLRYRARLGWAGGPDGAWSVVGFMNFWPHYNTNGGPLPPLCFLQGEPSCASFGPQFAQYTQQYPTLNNFVPGMYTFDLSVAYNTGDVPANRYLKNIQLAVTVNDLFNRAPPYQYSIATASNTPHAFYTPANRGGAGFGGIGADQRYITLTVTKTW